MNVCTKKTIFILSVCYHIQFIAVSGVAAKRNLFGSGKRKAELQDSESDDSDEGSADTCKGDRTIRGSGYGGSILLY